MNRRLPTLIVCLLLGSAWPAEGQDYPRLALYGPLQSDGQPAITGPRGILDGPLDPAVLDALARYHELIFPVHPSTDVRPDIISELRARNPSIHLLAYAIPSWVGTVEPSTGSDYRSKYYHLVSTNNGFLYDQSGSPYSLNVNLARRNLNGRFVIAEGIADLFASHVAASGLWDGLFLDTYCNSIEWSQGPGRMIDYQRAGYPTFAAFDAAYRAASDTLANRLRRQVGASFILVGNCAQGTKYSTFNGWMRENFPLQNGQNWYENMYRSPGGYFTDESMFRAPRHNYLSSWPADLNAPYSSENARIVRFGLGSAALGSGYGVFGPWDLNSMDHPFYNWWYDEYGVNLATRQSSDAMADRGWLGQPLGPAYQMVWVGGATDASSNPDFETDVTSGWNFSYNGSATLSRDTTTAASGRASARFDVSSQPGSLISYGTQNRIDVVAGRQYALTFWAKASEPITINVAAGRPGGNDGPERRVEIGTSWQHIQTVLISLNSGSFGAIFVCGAAPSTLWLDDVHFQAGTTSVYRRDFQNGSVLVNPGEAAQSPPLEHRFWKLRGNVDPVVNDGSEVTQVTVLPWDALFLISEDFFPPATVIDLRPVKP